MSSCKGTDPGRNRVEAMKGRNTVLLIAIVILALLSIYIIVPGSPGLHIELGPIKIDRDFEIRQGLDLQGGLQVLLEADLPPDQELDPGALDQAAAIIANRVNALGVVEPLVQTQGSRRIIVELPGVQDPDVAISTIQETSLLEFIDAGYEFLPLGTIVQTTYPFLWSEGATTSDLLPSEGLPTPSPQAPLTATTPLSSTEGLTLEVPSVITGEEVTQPVPTPVPTEPAAPTRVYATVLTGQHLKSANPYRDPNTGQFGVDLELTEEGTTIFADFTTEHADYDQTPFYYLSIALDKEIVSSPHIVNPIPEGRAQISGNFTLEEADRLAIQLRFGALPVPLRVETIRTIGPTLGQDSVQRSIQAGTVGLIIVLLFMLIYYRLPGLLADLALIFYGLLNLAVYEAGWPVLLLISLLMIFSYLMDREDVWPLVLGSGLLILTFVLATAGFIGVTLTLPAITGFILSTGMAVDANILVFERMKEELRAGRSLEAAMEAGFSRAWTSIRDSNISTLITCAILYYFGSTFGAGAVRGFAITLALGVVINMFTAITVTRTFMRMAFRWLGEKLQASKFLLGA
jgi:protein-export membrane protein SecD